MAKKIIKMFPLPDRVPFRNYNRYPEYLLEAAKFRDVNAHLAWDEYLKKAVDCDMAAKLVELASWEANFTE